MDKPLSVENSDSIKVRFQKHLETLEKKPRWFVFQGASMVAIFLCFLLALPLFIGLWKPEREKDSRITETKFTGFADDDIAMLPKNPAILSQRLQADAAFRGKYALRNSTTPYESMYKFSWFSGVLDLSVTAQELVPDSSKLELSISGHAYGPITYEGTDGDVVMLSIPSVIPNDRATKPVGSCEKAGSSIYGCADLIIGFGSQQLSYATPNGLGLRNFVVNVDASNGLDYYPFDSYTATGTIKAVVAMQMSKWYWFMALANALAMDNSSKPYNDNKEALNTTISDLINGDYMRYPDVDELTRPVNIRMQLSPSIQGWNIAKSELKVIKQNASTESTWFPGTTFESTGITDASFFADLPYGFLEYTVVYERSSFAKGFAISIVVCMWILSIYLLVLAVDHVIVRRRPLEPDTVGYSVGMLFALPALRLLLDAPFGSYIDFLGFAWNMVLVAFSVFLFFTGIYMDHHHKGRYFKKHDEEPQEVVIVDESRKKRQAAGVKEDVAVSIRGRGDQQA